MSHKEPLFPDGEIEDVIDDFTQIKQLCLCYSWSEKDIVRALDKLEARVTDLLENGSKVRRESV